MIRKILTTTALVAIMTSGAAYAADDAMTEQPAANTDARTGTIGIAIFKTTDPDRSTGAAYFSAMPGQVLASSLIGKSVYHGTGEDFENVGDVNDIVLGEDGNAEAIVIGVGGFLGIGEKDVAVNFDRLSWVNRDGDTWLTIAATKAELENAPTFDRSEDVPMKTGAAVPTNIAPDSQTNIDGKSDMAAGDAATPSTTAMDMDGAQSTAGSEMTAADSEAMTVVEADTVTADQIEGAPVYGAGNEEIGKVETVMVDSGDALDAYIVDVGGFLGIAEKPVAIAPDAVSVMRDGDGKLRLSTPFDRATLEEHVAYSKAAYDQNPEKVLIR